jgi:hypothetical protein
MDVFTNVSWPEIVDRERPGIEDEHNMHAQTVTVELYALLWVLDTYHQMVEAVLGGGRGTGPWWRDDVFAQLVWLW